MTQFARSLKWSLIAAAVAALSACGGDGGSDNSAGSVTNPTPAPTAAPTPTPTPAPSVQPFVATDKPQFFAIYGGSTYMGTPDSVQQDAAGAIRTVGRYVASADTTVGDVLSTAHVATGEWQSGTSSNPSSSISTPNDNKSFGYSYVVFNRISAYGADTALTCGTGHFTTPMNAGKFGGMTGTATLAISGGVANVAVSLTLTATDKSQTNIASSTSLQAGYGSYGSLLGGGTGTTTGLFLGEGETGGYTLIAPWTAHTTAAGDYSGIAVFNCK